MASKLSFADQVRRCIDGSGQTRHAIAIESGVEDSTISRFMNRVGNAGLSMDALNKIASVIGMKAVLPEQKKGRK